MPKVTFTTYIVWSTYIYKYIHIYNYSSYGCLHYMPAVSHKRREYFYCISQNGRSNGQPRRLFSSEPTRQSSFFVLNIKCGVLDCGETLVKVIPTHISYIQVY